MKFIELIQQLNALMSAQHFRSIASRITKCLQKNQQLPNFHSIYWRGSPWIPYLPADIFRNYGDRINPANYICGSKKNLFTNESSEKLLTIARRVEHDYLLGEQPPIWRKSPSKKIKGLMYNLLQIVFSSSDECEYHAKNTGQVKLKASKNKKLKRWMAKSAILEASLTITKIGGFGFDCHVSMDLINGNYNECLYQINYGFLSIGPKHVHISMKPRMHNVLDFSL